MMGSIAWRRLRTVFQAVVLPAMFAAPPRALLAQDQTGGIRGVVTGADTHVPIAGARVSLENPARVAVTDDKGAYALRDLPAGSYVVTATGTGREPLRSTVSVAAGQTASLDFALKEGSLMLSSVVTSATRTPTDANKVASTINVLTQEQIQTSPARESQDLLREIPGIELPRTSSLVGGTAQIVSIRGVDEGRTAVLFDGIPVNDAWGEWIDWGRMPKSLLDHVEVVEGGTSNLYGNGAMGGVISFFSRPIAPGSGMIGIDGGSRSARHGYGSVGLPLYEALSATVSGDYQENGGYNMIDPAKRGTIDVPSNVIQRNVYARVNYAPSADWSAFVTGHKFGDSRAVGTPLGLANRDQGSVDLGLSYGRYESGMLSVRAWDGHQDEHQRSTTIRSGGRVAEDSSVVANIPSHDWGLSGQWTRTGILSLESFSIGGDFRRMSGNFDEVDFNTTCPGTSCGTVSRRVLSGGDQDVSGIFAQAIAAPISDLRIELSARVDRWANNDGTSIDAAAGTITYPDRSKTAFGPRLGVRYQLMSGLSFHAAVYDAFRAPNLAELYRKQISATSITLPNPDLAPETAQGREAGVDWQPTDWVQFKGTWYVADYNDFNVPVTFAAGTAPAACGAIATCRQRLNINKSRSQGGEAYLAVRPVQELFISGSVNYDDDRQQSGLVAGTTNDNKPHINRVPSPKQNIRATYSSSLLGSWTAIWRHEGHTTTLQGAWLDPYTVVDASARRELLPGLSGFVSVENVGDTKYQVNLSGSGASTIVSFGLPRTIRLGLEAVKF